MFKVKIHKEVWHYNQVFRISREARTKSSLIMVEISQNDIVGRGECCPYARYDEDVDGVAKQIDAIKGAVEKGIDNNALLELLPAGAARNALDCALLDLNSKLQKTTVANMLGVKVPQSGITAETIVIDSPKNMFEAAKLKAKFPLLKVKLDAENVIERVTAVRRGAPSSQIIIDANEAWSFEQLQMVDKTLSDLGVCLIEQPLPAGSDSCLAGYTSHVPLCADESAHGENNFDELANHYAFINIKLDKTGGLTSAVKQAKQAKDAGLNIMVGCMVGSSLAMAQAAHLASFADFLDIDGPVFLKEDRDAPMTFNEGKYTLPATGLWGEG